MRKSFNKNTAGLPAVSQMLIGDYFGLPGVKRTAEWSANHDQILSLYKGSLYICTKAIASKIATMGYKVLRKKWKKSGEVFVPVSANHPLVELLNNPNPAYTPAVFHEMMISWQLLSGNAYALKVKNGFGTPVALHPISPQFVRVIPSSEEWVQGYRIAARYFGANMWDIAASEMIHVKEASPNQEGTQRFYGFPHTLACEAAVELENEMFTRERYRFSNYSEPGLILGTDQKIGSAHQLKQLVHEIWSQHRVAEQSGVPMVLHSGMKLLSDTKNGGSELNYADSLMMTLKFISATFSMPLEVVGLNQNASRASAQASLKTYAENCINPRLVAYGQALTNGLAKDFEDDLIIQVGPFDVSDLQSMTKAIETLGHLGAVDQNEARKMLFNLPPFEQGGHRPTLQAGVTVAPFGNDDDDENDILSVGGIEPDTQNVSVI